MPTVYTYEECVKLAIAFRKGEDVPDDWRDKCRGVKKPGGVNKPKPGSLAYKNRRKR